METEYIKTFNEIKILEYLISSKSIHTCKMAVLTYVRQSHDLQFMCRVRLHSEIVRGSGGHFFIFHLRSICVDMKALVETRRYYYNATLSLS